MRDMKDKTLCKKLSICLPQKKVKLPLIGWVIFIIILLSGEAAGLFEVGNEFLAAQTPLTGASCNIVLDKSGTFSISENAMEVWISGATGASTYAVVTAAGPMTSGPGGRYVFKIDGTIRYDWSQGCGNSGVGTNRDITTYAGVGSHTYELIIYDGNVPSSPANSMSVYSFGNTYEGIDTIITSTTSDYQNTSAVSFPISTPIFITTWIADWSIWWDIIFPMQNTPFITYISPDRNERFLSYIDQENAFQTSINFSPVIDGYYDIKMYYPTWGGLGDPELRLTRTILVGGDIDLPDALIYFSGNASKLVYYSRNPANYSTIALDYQIGVGAYNYLALYNTGLSLGGYYDFNNLISGNITVRGCIYQFPELSFNPTNALACAYENYTTQPQLNITTPIPTPTSITPLPTITPVPTITLIPTPTLPTPTETATATATATVTGTPPPTTCINTDVCGYVYDTYGNKVQNATVIIGAGNTTTNSWGYYTLALASNGTYAYNVSAYNVPGSPVGLDTIIGSMQFNRGQNVNWWFGSGSGGGTGINATNNPWGNGSITGGWGNSTSSILNAIISPIRILTNITNSVSSTLRGFTASGCIGFLAITVPTVISAFPAEIKALISLYLVFVLILLILKHRV